MIAAERTSPAVAGVAASGQPAVHLTPLYPAPVYVAALTVEQSAAEGQEFVSCGLQFVPFGH